MFKSYDKPIDVAAVKLMIFDPTDPDTPLGNLPDDEQNSFGLLVAGDSGALLRMPATALELNQNNRHVEVTLETDGSIKAELQEESIGQAGTVGWVSVWRKMRSLQCVSGDFDRPSEMGSQSTSR